MSERWLPIPNTHGQYEVSDQGRVRSFKGIEPRILRSHSWSRGYQRLDLIVDALRVNRSVHSLVLEVFVGPRPEGLHIRHLDGDPTNNALANLAYGTRSENEHDKVRHGTHNMASKTHCKNGHAFTPENTLETPRQRKCRVCMKVWQRNYETRVKSLESAALDGGDE